MRDAKLEGAAEKRARRIGEFLEGLGAGAGVDRDGDWSLTSFRVRLPTEIEPSCLLIVRASVGGAPRIAFIGAFTVGDALLAWRARVAAGGVKWREDVPWAERNGAGKG